ALRAFIKRSRGNHLHRLMRTCPREFNLSCSGAFEVIETNVVSLASLKRDRSLLVTSYMRRPVVNEQLPVDPHAHTFITQHRKGVGLAEGGLDLTRPANTKSIAIDAGRGGSRSPVMRHVFDASLGQPRKV